jgi:hypothetical protein
MSGIPLSLYILRPNHGLPAGAEPSPCLFWSPGSGVTNEDLFKSTAMVGRAERPLLPSEPVIFRVRKRPEVVGNSLPTGVTFGRTQNNDIVIVDRSVSRFHGYFQLELGGEWSVYDANSTIGTFVDGTRVPPGAPLRLAPRARIRIGGVDVEYFRDEAACLAHARSLRR